MGNLARNQSHHAYNGVILYMLWMQHCAHKLYRKWTWHKIYITLMPMYLVHTGVESNASVDLQTLSLTMWTQDHNQKLYPNLVFPHSMSNKKCSQWGKHQLIKGKSIANWINHDVHTCHISLQLYQLSKIFLWNHSLTYFGVIIILCRYLSKVHWGGPWTFTWLLVQPRSIHYHHLFIKIR